MKLDRKGFMLAEVVVVSVVIATVLVTLFTGLNRVSSAYSLRNRYYDLDSAYVAMEINDLLIRNNILSTLKTENTSKELSSDSNISSLHDFYSKTGSNIISYFTPYDKDKLANLTGKQTFNDYLSYLGESLDFDDDYDYLVIVERCESADDCYYYALKLNY